MNDVEFCLIIPSLYSMTNWDLMINLAYYTSLYDDMTK